MKNNYHSCMKEIGLLCTATRSGHRVEWKYQSIQLLSQEGNQDQRIRIIFTVLKFTNCKPIVLLLVCCLPTQCRRKKKRGKRASILWRSRTRCHNPLFSSILLVNVQSLDNKLDELHAQINYQRATVNCCGMAFTETWLYTTVADMAIAPAVFSIYREDRTRESGQRRGGGYALWLTLAVARM